MKSPLVKAFVPGVWYVKLLGVTSQTHHDGNDTKVYVAAKFEVEQFIPADDNSRRWDEFLDFLPGAEVGITWSVKYSVGYIKMFMATALGISESDLTAEVAEQFIASPPVGLHLVAYAEEIHRLDLSASWVQVVFSRSAS